MSPEAALGPLQEHTLAVVEAGAAFVEHARHLGHECGPLDWSPEIAHYHRDESRPGEELCLVPDAVPSYVHTAAKQRTLLTFFVEVNRTRMTTAPLAQKLYAYAAYHEYAPQPQTAKANSGPGARPHFRPGATDTRRSPAPARTDRRLRRASRPQDRRPAQPRRQRPRTRIHRTSSWCHHSRPAALLRAVPVDPHAGSRDCGPGRRAAA
ncbi:replication-relaxation family protein [Streptomyces sp. NPDC054840]